jgi:hypothetical protein
VSRIVRATSASCGAERLARVARRDEIHDAAPASAVEGGKVRPDRSAIQGRVLHPRHEDGRCVGVALDVTHGAIPCAQRKVQSEVEAADSGAEGEAVDGVGGM